MDPITAVFLGVGAAVAMGVTGKAGDLALLLLGAAFYGVYRATRTPFALALVGAPAFVWVLERLSRFAPGRLEDLARDSPVGKGLHWLAGLVLTAAFFASVVVARRRIGWGLAGLTMGALILGFLAEVPAPLPDPGTGMGIVLNATAEGWGYVGHRLVAASWLALALAPAVTNGLPRRIGALLGAVGATLLAAAIQSFPSFVDGDHDGVIVLFLFVLVVGWGLSAAGLGAIARAGVPAAWAGVGLAVFQILTVPAAIALFKEQKIATIAAMSTPFGLLAFGSSLLAARAFPLREVRLLAASLFLGALTGSLIAWLATFVGAARILRVRDPVWMLDLVVRPAATTALVVFAAYLAFVAAPPEQRPQQS